MDFSSKVIQIKFFKIWFVYCFCLLVVGFFKAPVSDNRSKQEICSV